MKKNINVERENNYKDSSNILINIPIDTDLKLLSQNKNTKLLYTCKTVCIDTLNIIIPILIVVSVLSIVIYIIYLIK